MLGRVLGDRYRVLSRLGEGGMGTVYLCEHVVLRRRFAVKVLRPDLVEDDELVDRFRNEAIAASRIGQENVVEVLDFGAEEDGALYYVMEALDGRGLGTLIREGGPVPVDRALDILEQVCRALAAAHASGVVHRDVKPDNVFLVRRDGAERVKVIDFGISHVPPGRGEERITRKGALIGTPEYMAPEQAAGHAVDGRTDVYAAGVLAYEMLTGGLPIEESTAIATLVAHQTRTPDPPSHRVPAIPPEVDALVLRALAKRPEDRFGSMEEFAQEVARVRAARGAPRRPTGPGGARAPAETLTLPPPAPTRRRARRGRPSGLAVAAAAACAAAAGVAWWWAAAGVPRRPDVASPAAAGEAIRRATVSAAEAAPLRAVEAPRAAAALNVAVAPSADVATASAPAQVPPAAPPDAEVAPPAPAPAVLVDEELRAAVAPPRLEPPPRPARRAARAPAAPLAPPDDGLKDPYSGAGGLKDPFQ